MTVTQSWDLEALIADTKSWDSEALMTVTQSCDSEALITDTERWDSEALITMDTTKRMYVKAQTYTRPSTQHI